MALNAPSLLQTIPEFSGDDSLYDIRTFEHSVAQAKALGQWSDEQTLKVINLKLKGSALIFSSHDPKYAAAKTVEEALSALKSRYDSKKVHGTALQQLTMSTFQKPGETVAQFASRVRELSHLAQPQASDKETFESIGLFFFLKNLHPQLKPRVLTQNPKTFDEAVQVALREEMNDVHYMGNPQINDISATGLENAMANLRVESLNSTNSIKPSPTPLMRARPIPPRNSGSSFNDRTTRSGPNWQPTCYRCHQFGHIARQCSAPAALNKCFRCLSPFHMSRECPSARSTPNHSRFSNPQRNSSNVRARPRPPPSASGKGSYQNNRNRFQGNDRNRR